MLYAIVVMFTFDLYVHDVFIHIYGTVYKISYHVDLYVMMAKYLDSIFVHMFNDSYYACTVKT